MWYFFEFIKNLKPIRIYDFVALKKIMVTVVLPNFFFADKDEDIDAFFDTDDDYIFNIDDDDHFVMMASPTSTDI